MAGVAVGKLSLHQHWGVQRIARYQRLLNEAAASPVVSERGSRREWVAGPSVIYAF